MHGPGSILYSQVANSLQGLQKKQSPQPAASSRQHAHLDGPRIYRSNNVRCYTAALEREALRAEAHEDEHVSRDTLPAPSPGQLQRNATVFIEEHRIRAYEVGADQKTTISTIANLLQVCTSAYCLPTLRLADSDWCAGGGREPRCCTVGSHRRRVCN